jgi:hypothetical protein
MHCQWVCSVKDRHIVHMRMCVFVSMRISTMYHVRKIFNCMASVAVGSLFTSTYAAHTAFDLLYYLALKRSLKFNYKLQCLCCARRVLQCWGNLTLLHSLLSSFDRNSLLTSRAREERSNNASLYWSTVSVISLSVIVLLDSEARGSVERGSRLNRTIRDT